MPNRAQPRTAEDQNKWVEFIQYALPPLRPDVYTLAVKQTVPSQDPGSFEVDRTFVVQGERYTLQSDEINSVFPPNNANGEFDGVLPHVVFNKCTVPWQRAIKEDDKADEFYPWLAVLLFNDGEQPTIKKVTAKDLIPTGTPITVVGSTITGTGTLASNTLSYSNSTLNPMGYGETPDMPTQVIDIDPALFSRIAPSLSDMGYLAHIRELDTSEGVDNKDDSSQVAVVMGNRVPATNLTTHAYLVSFENFADYLPDKNGAPSSKIQPGITSIRLICYLSWSYTANDLDQNLEKLLENLNQVNGVQGLTTLQLPITGATPTPDQISQAMAAQAAGSITPEQGKVLVQNALNMGYVPFDHHIRHGGNTVSFFRGPLSPYPIENSLKTPIATPDSANRYDPQTGLFDVSYGAAWQLGQLLILQNKGIANVLYEWKRNLSEQDAIQAEQALIESLFNGQDMFNSFFKPRKAHLDLLDTQLPQSVADWLGQLALLKGVPFNYLVPDERLLPQESLRFFYLDMNWIDALLDGAFSIGRTTTGEGQADNLRFYEIRTRAYAAMKTHRKNKSSAKVSATNPSSQYTGFLMRSQANVGWPDLHFKGYSDIAGTNEIKKLSLVKLSQDVVFCIFDGVVKLVTISETPMQLHLGVEGTSGSYFTTLREVEGDPGKQYTNDPSKKIQPCAIKSAPIACVGTRSDNQTLLITDAASIIQTRLVNDFQQTFPNGFTSAEFALEMTKGVVLVEYENS